MTNVKLLKPEVNQSLVENLEEMLLEAKEGKIQAAGVFTINTEGKFYTMHDKGTMQLLQLLGAAEALKQDVWMEFEQ